MKTEEIHEMWAVDCKIDSRNLDESSRQVPILHQKYLQIFSNERMRLIKLEMEQKVLLKDKFLYYEGKMTQEEMDARGWEYDPFKGLKILKGQMDKFYDADTDIQKSEIRIKLQKEKIEVLREIIDNLKFKHLTIKNMIEWRRFEAGG